MNKVSFQTPSRVTKPRQSAPASNAGNLRRSVLTSRFQERLNHPTYDIAALRDSIAGQADDIQASLAKSNLVLAARLTSRAPTPPPPVERAVKDVNATTQLHDVLEQGDDFLAVQAALDNGADATKSIASSNGHSAYFVAEQLGRTNSAAVLLDAALQKCLAVNAAMSSEMMDMARVTFRLTQDVGCTQAQVPMLNPAQLILLNKVRVMGTTARALRDAHTLALLGDSLVCQRYLTAASFAAQSVRLNIANDVAEIQKLCAQNLLPSISEMF